jgi:hypothetical protein
VNFKQVKFKLKKKFVSNSNQISSQTSCYRVKSNLNRLDSARLISNSKCLNLKIALFFSLRIELLNFFLILQFNSGENKLPVQISFLSKDNYGTLAFVDGLQLLSLDVIFSWLRSLFWSNGGCVCVLEFMCLR